jgi:hypothetical protein
MPLRLARRAIGRGRVVAEDVAEDVAGLGARSGGRPPATPADRRLPATRWPSGAPTSQSVQGVGWSSWSGASPSTSSAARSSPASCNAMISIAPLPVRRRDNTGTGAGRTGSALRRLQIAAEGGAGRRTANVAAASHGSIALITSPEENMPRAGASDGFCRHCAYKKIARSGDRDTNGAPAVHWASRLGAVAGSASVCTGLVGTTDRHPTRAEWNRLLRGGVRTSGAVEVERPEGRRRVAAARHVGRVNLGSDP